MAAHIFDLIGPPEFGLWILPNPPAGSGLLSPRKDIMMMSLANASAKPHNLGMGRIGIGCMGFLLMVAPCSIGAANSSQPNNVQLKAEKRTFVHLDQTVTLRLPSVRSYNVRTFGHALVAVNLGNQGATTLHQYRGTHPGDETILVVPANLPPRHCISCVTVHYFVTVSR